jgi:uncharacterized protein YjbJ (UPF0337 family)
VNWDQFQGKCKRFIGSVRERWGKLMGNSWATLAGKKDQLSGRIQEHYGLMRANADERADDQALADKGTERERRRGIRY